MRKMKMVKCPKCGRTFKRRDAWCAHMQSKHAESIPEGFTPMRYLYGVITGKYEGTCMYCGEPTEWNESTGKYGRLCGKLSCRDRYAKEHQLLSPDKQREMLSKRKLSSVYKYKGVDMLYTGTYELKFLTYMDHVMDWPASDLLSPSPNTYYYEYVNPEDEYHEGKKFYIPDFYIPSLNLEIEIKDQTTTHPKFLKIDKVKEACKDQRMDEIKNIINYYKINNNDFWGFTQYLEELKLTFRDDELAFAKRNAVRNAEEAMMLRTYNNRYDMPMSYERLVQIYGKKKADQLMKDPNNMSIIREGFESYFNPNYMVAVNTLSPEERKWQIVDELNSWCMNTGIFIIHPTRTEAELDHLYMQWITMGEEMKQRSDEKSMQVYRMPNITHYYKLKRELENQAKAKWKATEAVEYLIPADEDSKNEKAKDWIRDTGCFMVYNVDNLDELEKIYTEWCTMDESMKDMSDNKSDEIYGMNNREHYHKLKDKLQVIDTAIEGYVKHAGMDKMEYLRAIYNTLEEYGYGLKSDLNRIVFKKDPEYFYHNFRGLSPKEFNTLRRGICWDYTQSQKRLLSAKFTNVNNYMICINDGEITHSITIIEDTLIESPIYIETAYKAMKGIYLGKTVSDILNHVITKLKEINSLNPNSVEVYRYSITDEEYTGITYDQFFDYLNQHAEKIPYEVTYASPLIPIKTFEDLCNAINSIAEESLEDQGAEVVLPAMEAKTGFELIPVNLNWFQKMFVGMGVDSIFTKSSGRNIQVTVTNGMIHFTNIMARTLFARMYKYYSSKNIKNIFLVEYNPKSLKLYKKKKISRSNMRIDEIYAPEFFALELVEIFNDLGARYKDANYLKTAKVIYNKTWLSSSDNNSMNIPQLSLKNLSNLSLELLDYQKQFIANYPKLKAALHLNGYVLGFVQGLGKTLTAVGLVECMKFDHIYIVAPNSLVTNWALELRKYYQKYKVSEETWNQEVILCNKNGITPAKAKHGKFFITNNESINKMLPFVKPGKNILIVDESHNFRNINAKRTVELIALQKEIAPTDTLMMSGTPIKALPNEITPVLRLIDPMFTDQAAELYTKAFNIDNTSASNMISKRFGNVIYRKDKSELPNLPNKKIEELYYSVDNPKPYLLESVRAEFLNIFERIYSEKLKDNAQLLTRMQYFVSLYSSASQEDNHIYFKWLGTVNTDKFVRLHDSEQDVIVDFLKTYVYPNVLTKAASDELRMLEKTFIHMKNSALSTAMGQILPPRRRDLYIQLFDENFDSFTEKILECEKKTVIFSQFKPVIKYITEKLNEAGIETVMITGDNVAERMANILAFQEDDTIRVIAATSATMGTGFTLTEASQMFFFGTPWRDADFEQCCDRIHRIGQTDDVSIYVVLLESGTDMNVSTRINSILTWSKEMFDSSIIVTSTDETDVLDEVESDLDQIEAMECLMESDGYYPSMLYEAFQNVDMISLESLQKEIVR